MQFYTQRNRKKFFLETHKAEATHNCWKKSHQKLETI